MGANRLIAALFTDLVDSTALMVGLGPEAAERVRRRHLGHLRDATTHHGGDIVKSTGDGIMATFPSATAAVAAAVAMQQSVAADDDTALQLGMRVGLSIGDAVQDDGDWYGIPVIEAARLCSAAGAGQILATQLVRTLAAGGAGSTFLPLGPLELKGLPDPVDVVEVGWAPRALPTRNELPPGDVLIGRDAEVAALAGVVEAGATQLAVAVVEGEAGIGKSALVAELHRRATGAGIHSFTGRADEVDCARPLRAIVDAFTIHPKGNAGLREELARTLNATPSSEHDLTSALADLAVGLIEEAATPEPALLIVEDLHWADPVTVLALRLAAARLRELPVTIVVTLRPGQGRDTVAGLVEDLVEGGGMHLRLGPLALPGLQRLAARILGRPAGPELSRSLERAGGNPLYATELLRALEASGLFGEDGDLRPGAPVPTSAGAAIRRRLRFLDQTTMHLLEVASVLGREFRMDDLARASDESLLATIATLRPALDAGIVEDRGEVIRFTHDLVREAVYHGLPASARHALHRFVAATLLEAGAEPARVAAHLLMAPLASDDHTIDLLLRVGSDLRQLAPALALEVFHRGIEATGPHHPRHREFARAMLWPLVLRGRFDEADAILAGLRAGVPDAELDADDVVREAIVYRHLRRGRTDLFRAELERLHATTLDDAGRAWVESRLLIARIYTGDADAAARLADAVERQSRSAPDERLRAYCLTVLTVLHCAQGDVPAALHVGEQAIALHSRLLGNVALVYLFVALAFVDGDRFDDAFAAIQDGLREDMEEGDTSSLAVQHWLSSFVRYTAGQWDEALTEAETGLDLFDEGGQTSTGIMFGFGVLARIALHRDDLTAAEAFVARADDLLGEGVSPLGYELVLWVKALVLELRGRAEEAWAAGRTGWELTGGIRYYLTWRTTAPDLVRLALAAGDLEGAAAVTDAAIEGAQRASTPGAEAVALACEGLLTGRHDLLVAAVDRFRLGPRTVAAAHAAERAGSACAADGLHEPAVSLLQEARTLWVGLDAPFDEVRCRAALEGLGVARSRRRASVRPSSGWESLTPAERRVADLMAKGHTNRQIAPQLFISPHTVDTHVRHILRKLGLRSRVEVAAEAARRERNP